MPGALSITALLGLSATLGGIYMIVLATQQWRLFELTRPSRVPPIVKRVLGGMAGSVFVALGVLLIMCDFFVR